MSGYRISFSDEGDIARIDFRDRFVAPAILSVILELKQDSRYFGIDGVLWDLTQSDLSSLTIESLRDIFSTQKSVYPSKFLRVACVISSESDAHILKLWAEGFNDANPNHRRWFFRETEATAWLRQADQMRVGDRS